MEEEKKTPKKKVEKPDLTDKPKRKPGRPKKNPEVLTDSETKKEKVVAPVENIKEMDDPSIFRLPEVIFLLVLTAIISVFVGSLVGRNTSFGSKNTAAIESDPYLQEFIENYHYILDNYYEEVDPKEVMENAIKGLLSGFDDPNTGFLDTEENSTLNKQLTGYYDGIGVQVANRSTEDGKIEIYVVEIFDNSPAKKADLQVGDVIVALNGEDMQNQAASILTSKIADLKSKEFTLTVSRDGKNIDIKLKSGLITIDSVHEKIFTKNDKKIGYLMVDIFASNTYTQFKNKLEKLESENIDSLIIDVRDNSGGHLSSVKNMISLFLDESHVIYQTETNKETEKVYSTSKASRNYPIVVLTNEISASASEMLASALQEQYQAILVGTKTFGKGTVQELRELDSGNQYKFTTKKWLTSKGVWIHGKGITPDVEVALSDEYYQNPSDETDNQLQKALEILAK